MSKTPVQDAVRQTHRLAHALGDVGLEALCQRALDALAAAPGGSELQRLKVVSEVARAGALPEGGRKILRVIRDMVGVFPLKVEGRKVLDAWETIMTLAANNPDLVDRVAGDPAGAVIQEHLAKLEAAYPDTSAFGAAADALVSDPRLKAADQTRAIAMITDVAPKHLSSRDKRRNELIRWRLRQRDREAIFQGVR